MMNIGLSTSVIGRGKTGIAQYLFGLLRALEPCAGQHRFFLFVLEEDLPLFAFAKKFAKLIPVSERFRPPVKDIYWHQTKLPRLARELQLSVLHIPSYRRMVWSRPCPRVVTIHDLAPCIVKKKYEWKRMLYGRFVARRLARRQDEIIAVSHNTATDINACFRIAGRHLTVIPNGLDHQRFSPGPPEAAQKVIAERFKLAGPYFLYVARLEHPAKNHCRLIAAFNEFKAATRSSWKLAFAGSDWQNAGIIHQTARQSPFASDIQSLGFVADADLSDLYRAAGVFIYPSLYEGFGIPPIEAMACGCPVIASSRGALAEVLGRAAEIIVPEDVNSMAKAMTGLACNSSRRESLRQAGFRRAKSFDWQKTAAATLQVYEKAAGVGLAVPSEPE